ncbi:MAG: glycosyl transferase family protein [Rhodospirillaceae bacterium]
MVGLEPYLLADVIRIIEWTGVLVAIFILLSSLDDFFIDAYYWARAAYRFVYVQRKHKPLDIAKLLEGEELPIAIMVPAWREDGVIAQMIENTVASVEYSNFKIFCGSYPNDPATGEVIDAMARRYKHVVHVRVPHPGPTCKADCLNWIIQAIFLHEEQHDMKFGGIAMHDSEDVIHPMELKLFNFLLPKKDFIQLPVLSLERPWWQLVAGTYLDDFAEWHSKDLVVRESFLGEVPSAGVGTCFSRRAIMALCAETGNQPYNTDSLTEDYDFSFRLAKLGMSQVFVRVPVGYKSRRKTFTGKEKVVDVESVIAIREYFPDSFVAAYRQRARWIYGIAFQGWLEMGWGGSWRRMYMLLRDRKGAITCMVTIFAYLLLLSYLAATAAAAYFDIEIFTDLIASHDWMQEIIVMNVALLMNRVAQRFYFVTSMYGPLQGLMAIPRLVVNNAINFMAAARAWRMLGLHVFKDKSIAWDKTDHVYPSTDHLRENKKRLGDLVVAWKAVSADQLAHALAKQAGSTEHLGKLLMREGWLTEDMLAEVLAYQNDLPRGTYDRKAVRANKDLLSREMAVRHRVLPAGRTDEGALRIFSGAALSEESLAELQGDAPHRPLVSILCESEIVDGLRALTDGEAALPKARTPLLGDLLVEMGFARRQDLNYALRQYSPERHGRFGDFLLAEGTVSRENLDTALAHQATLSQTVP